MPVRAQENLRFSHYSVDNGLSQNVVYSLCQDSKGFLWIGTHDGLNRFDGYEFKKFNYHPQDSNSLAENVVHKIEEDSDGTLWIKTTNYLHRFPRNSGKFERYKIPDPVTKVSLRTGSVKDFRSEDMIPVETQFSGWLFNKQNKNFIPLTYENGDMYSLHPSAISNTHYFLGQFINTAVSRKGFYFFDSNKKILWPATSGIFKGLIDEEIIFFSCSNELLYAINKRGELLTVSKSNISRKKIPDIAFIKGNIIAIQKDQNGLVWIVTKKEIIKADVVNDIFEKVIPQFANNQRISEAEHKSMLIDKTGNLWAGTFGDGLRKFNVRQNNISNYSYNLDKTKLPGKFVHALRESQDGSIYISFYETKQFAVLNAQRSKADVIDKETVYNSKTELQKLHNKELEQLLPFPVFKKNLPLSKLFIQTSPLLFKDKLNRLWAKDDYSLQCISTSERVNTGSFIESVFADKDNNFWIATNGKGLGLYNPVNKELFFFHANGTNGNISSNSINSMLYDSMRNSLWLATQFGLSQFELNKKKSINYNEADGLCHNNIYNMVMDDDGFLWLGTGNGISRFDTAEKKFRNYNRNDGFINIEYNRYCAIRTRNGELVFGGTEGIDIFYPKQLSKPAEAATVVITDLKIFNKSIAALNSISLAHHQNNLTISFAAMDFTNPGKTKYAYMLQNIDREWIYTEGKNTVSYATLRPGKYRFIVKAASDDGEWNKNPTYFDFTIHPPWWQSWWFYLLLAIAITGFVLLLFRYRLQKKLELLQVRNRIHRDLHDDVGATLSTVKAYTEMLKTKPGEAKYLELISDNANEMLEKLEIITWASNPRHDSMHSLVEKMKQQVNTLFYHKGIELEWKVDPGLSGIELPGIVRQNLFLIFKEASNNIIKYAGATNTVIRLYKGNNKIIMALTDNGKGFSVSQVKMGNGLYNIQSRAAEVGGQCIIDSVLDKGTSVQVLINYPFKLVAT